MSICFQFGTAGSKLCRICLFFFGFEGVLVFYSERVQTFIPLGHFHNCKICGSSIYEAKLFAVCYISITAKFVVKYKYKAKVFTINDIIFNDCEICGLNTGTNTERNFLPLLIKSFAKFY